MSPQQKVLFLNEPKGEFSVGLADIDEPGPGEILVEVHSTALNPVDWIVRDFDILIAKYPAIGGYDAAGIIKQVGEGVSNLTVGDEVLWCGSGTMNNRQATFKQYAIAEANLVAKKPSNLTFDEAASVPLTMATAAVGLYGKKTDGTSGAELYPPWEDGGRDKYAGQPILVIGAGSNVGCHVIEFAKLSGFSPIIVTASKGKEAYLKSLGATHVIDRIEPISDLPTTIKGITDEPIRIIYDAVSRVETENVAYDILASGGKMIVLANFAVDKSKVTPDKEILVVNGNFRGPAQRQVGIKLYATLTEFLALSEIKPSNVITVLSGGLTGIPTGLEELKGNYGGAQGKLAVTGSSKLVAHPLENP